MLTAAIAYLKQDGDDGLEVVDFLLTECGVDVNVPSTGTKPWPPLLFAIKKSNVPIVEQLLKKGKIPYIYPSMSMRTTNCVPEGANVNFSQTDSAATMAVTSDFQAEIDATLTSRSATALFLASSAIVCDKITEELVEILLKAGAKVDHENYYKVGRCNTPLMAACYLGGYYCPRTSLMKHTQGTQL